MSSHDPVVRAALLMVAASLFIALSTFLAKGVANRFDSIGSAPMHPLQITAVRFLVGMCIWTLVFAVRRPDVQKIHWQLHVARSLFGWMSVTAIFWASSLMVLADATAIGFLTPVVSLVLAVLFLQERVGRYRWSAVAVMLFGAMVLLRPGSSAFQPAALIALLAAFTSAVEVTLIKRITTLEPRLQILFVNNLIGAAIALSAAFFVWSTPSMAQWGVMLLIGLSMAAAQVFFLTSMRDADASYVVPFMYSTLLFAAVLDYSVFGDRPDAIGAFGALIIVAGALFLAWRESTGEQGGVR